MKTIFKRPKPWTTCGSAIFVLFVLAFSAACQKPALDGLTFSDAGKGFSIARPAGWRYATADEIREMRAKADFQDEDFQAAVRERAVLPFVVIMKHDTAHEGLNPSVQVIMRPVGELEKMPVLFILNMLLPSFERALPDFEIVEDPRLEKLDGRDAAFVKSKYSYITGEETSFPTLNRMWIVRRGKDLFMISMIDAPEGADSAEAEFAEILKSIKIEG